MSLLSLKQFQELINTAIDYQPHRDRFDGEHPSAELFTGAGNIVNSIRLKFYIQDDGGTWDWTQIAKPQFIWDMKKIIAGTVIDDGMSNKNAHLACKSVNEIDDGVYFYESPNSILETVGQFSSEGLDFNKTIFNCWFRPELTINYSFGTLFDFKSDGYSRLKIMIGKVSDDKFYIRIYAITGIIVYDRIINGDGNVPFTYGKKYNLQVVFQNLSFKVIVNGSVLYSQTLTNNLAVTTNCTIKVGYLYKGEISYITLNAYYELNDYYLEAFWKYKYPLPRGPELVDLSDYFEQQGRDLLIEVGDINKAIENIRGQLYVKTNTVKLRDL